MTINKLAAGVAGALFVTFAGSVAFAASSAGGYACQASNPTKVGPPVTHCLTWTREAAANMRAANCDPAMKGDAAMRSECLAAMSDHHGDGSRPAAAG